ncbi:MAG: BLUF domain-containing protein [Opitutaceae bacterium]
MSLFHLVYASSATVPFPEADLRALLEVSRRKNSLVGVSGMLLYRDGNFMQVLEGEEPVVRGVHLRIARDPRHSGLLTLLQGAVAERSFPNWTMGFRNLESAELKNTPGYDEFLNDDWLGAKMVANPSRAMQLLEIFRQNMR